MKNELNWSEIEKAAKIINKINKMRMIQISKTQMIDELFDEVLLAKSFFQNSNEANYSEKWGIDVDTVLKAKNKKSLKF